MVTMLRADTPDMGDGHASTEAKILRRFRELVTYCLGPRLFPELIQCVLDSMEVEITEKKCCLLESKWKIKYDLLRN